LLPSLFFIAATASYCGYRFSLLLSFLVAIAFYCRYRSLLLSLLIVAIAPCCYRFSLSLSLLVAIASHCRYRSLLLTLFIGAIAPPYCYLFSFSFLFLIAISSYCYYFILPSFFIVITSLILFLIDTSCRSMDQPNEQNNRNKYENSCPINALNIVVMQGLIGEILYFFIRIPETQIQIQIHIQTTDIRTPLNLKPRILDDTEP